MTDLDTRVHLLLRAGGHTIATAESLTGGRLAVHLTDVPGASETYLGGVVTYATEVKSSVLDVPAEVIDEHGVVSAECAKAMATGVRGLTGASFGVSTTGVAGPTEQEGTALTPDGKYLITSMGLQQASISLKNASGDRQLTSE